jgi:hypothetical protein
MTEYEHRHQMVAKDSTIDIPDNATGITTDTFGDQMTVHYLVPEGTDGNG